MCVCVVVVAVMFCCSCSSIWLLCGCCGGAVDAVIHNACTGRNLGA